MISSMALLTKQLLTILKILLELLSNQPPPRITRHEGENFEPGRWQQKAAVLKKYLKIIHGKLKARLREN
jgi:hypothetical protein